VCHIHVGPVLLFFKKKIYTFKKYLDAPQDYSAFYISLWLQVETRVESEVERIED